MQHPVPDEHLKHIGDITVSFALLESQIKTLIGSLIAEHQRIGQIITAQLSFRNLLDLVISLYLERHGEDDDYLKLKLLMNKAGNIEENGEGVSRNKIIHSIWAAGRDKDHITRVKTNERKKNGLKFQFEELSAQELAAFAKETRNLADEISRFYLKLIENNKAINNPIKKFW